MVFEGGNYFRNPTLLEFIAENPIRRGTLPENIAEVAKVILDAQKVPQGPHAGGWRYQINSADADISVTGWQLMALRGAANCGAAVPRSALDDGLGYVRRNAVPTLPCVNSGCLTVSE